MKSVINQVRGMSTPIKKRALFAPALLALLLSLASCKVNIWEPKSLKSFYAGHDIPYSVMNFGIVPYGHSVYGTVFKASPFDACTELSPLKWDKNYGTLILLVERGGCNFSEKVLNAQRIGAGLVLIADNNNEDVHKIFPVERTKEMLDKVHIPSVLISKADSDNFLGVIEAPNANRPHESGSGVLELAVYFDLVKSHSVSNVKLILQVDDYRSYDVISDFLANIKSFESYIDLKILFKVFFNAGVFFLEEDCIKVGNDSFCVAKSFGNDKKDLGLIEETMKQLCLKNHDLKAFIGYSRRVRKQCFGDDRQVVSDFKACTGRVYEAEVDARTRSALQACATPDTDANKAALAGNHEEIKYFLINYAPLIFINGFYYKGNFDDTSHLFEAICNSFETPPAPCHSLDLFINSNDLNSASLTKFVMISLVGCIFMVFMAIVLFYIVYKKKIRKRFNFELNDKINEALAKYYSEGEEGDDGSSSKRQLNDDDDNETTVSK